MRTSAASFSVDGIWLDGFAVVSTLEALARRSASEDLGIFRNIRCNSSRRSGPTS